MAEQRTKLKELTNKERHRFKGICGRIGIKNNSYKDYPERTFVLNDVSIINPDGTEEILTDHLWITAYKQFQQADIKAGDVVIFNARVGMYRKGYSKLQRDYKLERPTQIEIIRECRELREGELTTSTIPTYQELEEARETARKAAREKENYTINLYGFSYKVEHMDTVELNNEEFKELSNNFEEYSFEEIQKYLHEKFNMSYEYLNIFTQYYFNEEK